MKLRLDAAEKLTMLSVDCVQETKLMLADFEKKIMANEVKDEPSASPAKNRKCDT